MLALALVVSLAASTADVVTRIPGTKLRLGMSETQLMEQGAFAEAKVADAAGTTTRQGPTKFFGVPCQATLYFRDGVLARARLEATAVSPHMLDYVEGQLQRAKMVRECTRFEPGDHACDWLGDVKIHLEFKKDKLDARVEWPPRPWETEPDPAPAATATTPPATAAPTVIAPAATPESGTSAPAAPATPPSTTAPSTVAPDHAIQPVPTLPETLRLSLPGRPTEWPRMTHVPKLSYPEAARRESVQGVVWVLALVDADGTVRSATIDRGIRELNDAAIAWATQARFAPCVRDGRPCRFWVRLAARFTLH